MLKIINFFMISVSFSTFISNSYAMDDKDRAAKIRARLQNRRAALTPSPTQESPSSLQIQTPAPANRNPLALISNPGFEAEMQAMTREDQIASMQAFAQETGNMIRLLREANEGLERALFPPASPYDAKIHKLDNVLRCCSDKKTMNLQNIETLEFLSDKSKMASIKEDLLSRLKAGSKYITSARDLIDNEAKYHSGQATNFSPEEAFGTDLLPFEHQNRKQFVLTINNQMSPSWWNSYPCPVDDKPSKEAFEALRKPGPGLATSMLIYDIGLRDFNNPNDLAYLYAILFRNILAEFSNYERRQMILDKELPDSLHIKHRRLLSSLSDGEIEDLFKCADILFPYIKAIQGIFQVPGYDEVFTCKSLIDDVLDKRRLDARRGPPFSRKTLLLLQERWNQQQVTKKEPQIEKPTVVETKTLASKETRKYPLEIEYPQPSSQNLKNEYRKLSEIEARKTRKLAAKEKKNKHAESNIASLTEPLETKEKPLEKPQAIVKIGGGPFKIYQKIMDKTFKGTIEKVILLIEALGGTIDNGRSGSRLKIELPHINNNAKRIYSNMLPLENDEENDIADGQPMPTIHDGMHAPHKNRSNKLREYHVKTIHTLLVDAGYGEGAVQQGGTQDEFLIETAPLN